MGNLTHARDPFTLLFIRARWFRLCLQTPAPGARADCIGAGCLSTFSLCTGSKDDGCL